MTEINVTVFEVSVSLDQDDPDIIAAFALHEWEKSEAGKWLLKHSKTTLRWRTNDPADLCLHYKIVATLTPEKYTFWSLTYK